MPLLDYILAAITLVYLTEMILFRRGLDRADAYERNLNYQPTVSVIVAARNEEANISASIASLAELDYPSEKLEIIVVNDGSTDTTVEVVREWSQKNPRVKFVNAKPGTGELRGKANALAQGIEQSKGEILMFTDADCTAPKTWVRETVSYYTDGVGVVAGFTYLRTATAFQGIQGIDWFMLFGAAATTAAWNIPLTAVGNNLSVRRSAYDAVGGYRKLPFSVTEDYTLVQAIWQQTRQKIHYPLNVETLVESKPCPNWKTLFRQKQRWGVGGMDMVLRGLLIMSVHTLMHLAVIIGLFMVTPSLLVGSIAAKVLADFYFLWKPINVFKKLFLIKYFLLFEIYYSIYELLLPLVTVLSRKVVWKERAFGERPAKPRIEQ